MEHPCSRCCPSCCGCYCSLALVLRLCSLAGPRLSPPVVFPLLVYPHLGVLVDPRQPLFMLAAVCLLAPPIVFSPARLPPLGCAGSPHQPPFVLTPVCLLAPVCPHSCSFVLCAPQPLICVCIKYISTYIMKLLTFIS